MLFTSLHFWPEPLSPSPRLIPPLEPMPFPGLKPPLTIKEKKEKERKKIELRFRPQIGRDSDGSGVTVAGFSLSWARARAQRFWLLKNKHYIGQKFN